MFVHQISGSLFVVAAAALAAGCARSDAEATPNALRGTMLAQPLPKTDFTLTGTDGRPYDFRRETDGSLTMLFFGYTNCPDVCPVQLHNVAAVLQREPYEVSSKVKVVFVTTDPERDTPEVLRRWLDGIDPSFVGLRGSPDQVAKIQRSFGLTPAVREGSDSANYTVGHAAQVIAFTPDNQAHVVYPFGTRQADWDHDIPLLVQGRWSAQ
jgi:protein SCO1/2